MDDRPDRRYVANPADLPRGTLVELFFDAVTNRAKAAAQFEKVGGEWRPISHGELAERVRLLVLALEAYGIRRGDRVAILSENRPEWALADYAILCLGAQGVPIYGTLPPDQVAYILENSGARAIFVSTAEQAAKVAEVRDRLPALERVIAFDAEAASAGDVLPLSEVLDLGRREAEAGKGSDFRERALEAKPDDVATVIYTSGTTGEPKGVMLTHQNIHSNVRAVEGEVPVGPDDVSLSFLPLSHILQRMVDYFLFWKGCTIAYVRSMDDVPQSLVEVRPTIVVAVPRVYEKVYTKALATPGFRRRLVLWARAVALQWADARAAGERPGLGLRIRHGIADRLVYRKLRERMGGRIRFFISGGAPLSPDIAKFFYGAGMLILEGYGLTETSPVTNLNAPDAFRFGTVGKPIPGTEEAIAEDGEVLVRGPQVMKGYYNNPEATRAAIDEDGWFHTGDIGEFDQDGFLRITDRKKDLIVTAGGKNIAPQPIENRVKRSRYIAEAVMVGDRRPYPVLLVVPNFEQLEKWAAARGVEARGRALAEDPAARAKLEREVSRRLEGLARFELPKKVGILAREFSIEEGELTPTLKVRRRVVEQRYRDLIEALYAEGERVVAD